MLTNDRRSLRLQGEVILAAMLLDDQGRFAGLEPIVRVQGLAKGVADSVKG